MFSSKTVNDLTESIIHSHRRFIHVRRFTSHKMIEAVHKRVSIQKRGGEGRRYVEGRYAGPLVPHQSPIFISPRDLSHQAQFISVTHLHVKEKFK